jgi:hypothetical protein
MPYLKSRHKKLKNNSESPQKVPVASDEESTGKSKKSGGQKK